MGLRDDIEERMRGDGGGAIGAALSVMSKPYGALVGLRLALYKAGLLKKTRLVCKVVSIGNLTVGGTGKTPMTMAVASRLKEKGFEVCVISRGYSGSANEVTIVSDGKAHVIGPAIAGDEPCLMAQRLTGVPVIVGRRRAQAGLLAIESFSPQVIVLDDAYQHLAIERDVNILLVDAKEGFGNGRLVPAGILREPTSAVKRASYVFVKGKGLKASVAGVLSTSGLKAAHFDYRAVGVRDIRSDQTLGIDAIRSKKVFAFAGLANPRSFFDILRALGAKVVGEASFPDHHAYTMVEIDKVRSSAKGADLIVTTEKDAVKLGALFKGGDSAPRALALVIDVAFEDSSALDEALSPIIGKPNAI